MDDRFRNLLFGIAIALVLPAICFALGMSWSKLIGGWQDHKFRKWWGTTCLLMPFLMFGFMVRRMAEDRFEAVRMLWSGGPSQIIFLALVAVLTMIASVVGVLHLWRSSRN
jgi:hypothetical protein